MASEKTSNSFVKKKNYSDLTVKCQPYVTNSSSFDFTGRSVKFSDRDSEEIVESSNRDQDKSSVENKHLVKELAEARAQIEH
jgi:septal ring factor EnvC (AmiA/AmiB activator)